MEELVKKASVLQEALPYIRRFRGKTFVIKYGGHAMVDEALCESFVRDLVLLHYVGVKPIVVHGGGPQIDEVLERFGLRSQRVEGLRITDAETMDVVSMVLRGKVNREIVTRLQQQGVSSVGLSGIDGGLLSAEKLPARRLPDGREVDVGRVGAVTNVDTRVLLALQEQGLIPVIAPMAADANGEPLNINADTVAGEIAAATRAEKLVLMTDTPGVRGGDGELLKSLTPTQIRELKKRGVIVGGMIPKVDCAVSAVHSGVRKCHIVDGRQQHAILLEIFTDEGIGTEIVRRAVDSARSDAPR